MLRLPGQGGRTRPSIPTRPETPDEDEVVWVVWHPPNRTKDTTHRTGSSCFMPVSIAEEYGEMGVMVGRSVLSPSPMTHHHHSLILGNLGNVLGGHSL